jgi:hypothetical protein
VRAIATFAANHVCWAQTRARRPVVGPRSGATDGQAVGWHIMARLSGEKRTDDQPDRPDREAELDEAELASLSLALSALSQTGVARPNNRLRAVGDL